MMYTGSNSSLKTAGMKKTADLESDDRLPKKWVSLDDLTSASDADFLNDSEAKIKKETPKSKKVCLFFSLEILINTSLKLTTVFTP